MGIYKHMSATMNIEKPWNLTSSPLLACPGLTEDGEVGE
jgi:hypothetical protein